MHREINWESGKIGKAKLPELIFFVNRHFVWHIYVTVILWQNYSMFNYSGPNGTHLSTKMV